MTYSNKRTSLLDHLDRVALGFGPIFHDIENRFNVNGNYPPYNVAKNEDGKLFVEVAVAGFTKDDISAEVHEGKLTIAGKKPESDKDVKYSHKGISQRAFKLSWTLADHVEVTSAGLADGILTVGLKENVPDEAQPKVIDIS